MSLLVFLGGLVALLGGAEFLVRGASRIARLFGLSPLLVGLTVVSPGPVDTVAYLCDANTQHVLGPIGPVEPVVVGRSSRVDISISEDAISSQHLRITWDGKRRRAVITDLGSANGTYCFWRWCLRPGTRGKHCSPTELRPMRLCRRT